MVDSMPPFHVRWVMGEADSDALESVKIRLENHYRCTWFGFRYISRCTSAVLKANDRNLFWGE